MTRRAARQRSAIGESSARRSRADHQLNGYEIPRDFLLETEPFSLENGLLSGVGKFLRPKLKDRYGAASRAAVRQDGRRPDQRAARTAGRRCRSAGAGDGGAGGAGHARRIGRRRRSRGQVHRPGRRFAVGADVLAAARGHLRRRGTRRGRSSIRPATCLRSPNTSNGMRDSDGSRPTFASVHGADSTEVRAEDLTLDKFIDADLLNAAAIAAAAHRRRPDGAGHRRDRISRAGSSAWNGCSGLPIPAAH